MLAPSFLLIASLAATAPNAAPADAGSNPSTVVDDAGAGAMPAEELDAGNVLPAPTPGCELRFVGNRVLAEEVYRAVLDLPGDATADEPTATLVRKKLEVFLHRSGYELGTVTTQVVGGKAIEITIDEGRLEKIVFRGNFNLNTLRFQIGLQLPYEIFNRPELDRQVGKLTAALGLGRVWYKLVATKEVKHLGPQVESLGEMGEVQGHELIHPQEAYELHIFFSEKLWDTGAWLDLRTSNQDGFEVIGTWQGQDLLLPDDRYRTSVSGGVGIRKRLADSNYYPTFSRTHGEADYYFPVPKLRPLLEGRFDLVSRQRPDLGLEQYYNLFADTLASGQYEFARRQNITFGFGLRYQRLFGETPWWTSLSSANFANPLASSAPISETRDNPPRAVGGGPNPLPIPAPVPDVINAIRPFAELRLNLLFDDGHERPDRRSDVTLEARQFFGANEPEFGEARAAWQQVIPLGWHDLWFRASGAYIWGAVPFHNEEPLNGHLRNVFSDIYVHKVASEATEFRFSITRDVFKFSFFNDVATFGEIDRATGNEKVAIGDCFGPGFHALLEGIFQIDMYYAVGFTTARNNPLQGVPSASTTPHFDNGFSLSLQKVF